MKLRSLSVCVILLSSLWAQDTPGSVPQPPAKAEAAASGSQRPRIGLVLEGGGALGLAHVGVIRWLEENRIPVDVIAGTSMGALVGGIYASGESPDQIAALIRNIQWTEVL
ncbi:MAG TPA: patatin-like phospholipase family protein, partial [Terriglobales bacterium]|nr:patatin-like phospholipase family protein [Terriglobales bacterium]